MFPRPVNFMPTSRRGPALALPQPGQPRLRRSRGRLVLAVAPRATRASFVVPGPARRADHDASPGGFPGAAGAPGSGRVGPAHAAPALRGALVLVEPAPGAVLLGPGDRVGQALRADRACGADRLGLALADLALGLALAVGAEEENDVLATARGSILPAPVRPGRQCHLSTYLRHESISSSRAVCSTQRPAGHAALRPALLPRCISNALSGCRVPGRRRSGERPSVPKKIREGKSRCRTGRGRECTPAVLAKPVSSANRRSMMPPRWGVPQPGGRITATKYASLTEWGVFMITNWTKSRFRVHHGQHVSVGRGAFAPAG